MAHSHSLTGLLNSKHYNYYKDISLNNNDWFTSSTFCYLYNTSSDNGVSIAKENKGLLTEK